MTRMTKSTAATTKAIPMPDSPSQLVKFKELARELEAEEDEKHWVDRLRKLAKVKPVDPPSKP